MLSPGTAARRRGVQSSPRVGRHGAETVVGAGGLPLGRVVGARVGKSELLTVAGLAARTFPPSRPRPAIHDPVGADTPEQVDRQISQQPGQTHHVVSGVQHNQHQRIVGQELTGLAQSVDQIADLRGGHVGDIVIRADTDHVQWGGPRRAARPDPRRPPNTATPGWSGEPRHSGNIGGNAGARRTSRRLDAATA